MSDRRLPVLPHPGDDEPLGAWVMRLAAHNRTSPHQVMGHKAAPEMLRRLDRFAHPGELHRLQQVSGLPVDRLRGMTLAGRFPGAAQVGGWVPADEARRSEDAPCLCCGPDTGLSSLLRLLPLCGRCGRLLDDGTGYSESDIDPHLMRIQQLVTRHAQAAQTYAELRNRVGQMRSALRHNWPTPPAREPVGRLQHALQLLAADPTTSSPTVTAVLLTRALEPTIENDPQVLVRHDNGWWPTADETDVAPLGDVAAEVDRLHTTIRACRIEVRHVPLAITLGCATPLLHRNVLPRRETWAATLREQAAQVAGIPTALSGKMLGTPTTWPLDDPWTIRLLTDTATTLHRDGLLDRDLAVETFKHRASIPTKVLRQLPPAAREVPTVNQVAAAWVWLTMTGAGALRVLHRGLHGAGTLIPRLHHALTAEGRLVLTEYGLQELGGWPDTTAALSTLANTGRDAPFAGGRRVG